MSIKTQIASKLVKIREELHELAGKLENVARRVDINVDTILEEEALEEEADVDDELFRYGRIGCATRIGDFTLKLTSPACPEQYDAYYGEETVPCAYFRLRNGIFNVRVPDVDGLVVYQTNDIAGDGCFDNEQERSTQLLNAVTTLEKYLLRLYRKTLPKPQEFCR